MELKDFKESINTSFDKEFVKKYLEQLTKASMRLYINENPFFGLFKNDSSLRSEYKATLDEVMKKVSPKKLGNITEDKPIRMNLNDKAREDDSDYIHKIIIKAKPESIIDVAASIVRDLEKREINDAFVEIPSIKEIEYAPNESIVVKCTTEELENTIKCVSALRISYRTSTCEPLPFYAKTGTWFAYDQINPETKELASFEFARSLKSAIDDEIASIRLTDEKVDKIVPNNKNALPLDVIKDYILTNDKSIENITSNLRSKCVEKGLSEKNPLLYASVLDEIDKVYTPSIVVNAESESISEGVEQPPIDFDSVPSEKVENNEVSAVDMVNEIDKTLQENVEFNEQVEEKTAESIEDVQVSVEEPNIEVPNLENKDDIFAPDFEIPNEKINLEDLSNDALDSLQNSISEVTTELGNSSSLTAETPMEIPEVKVVEPEPQNEVVGQVVETVTPAVMEEPMVKTELNDTVDHNASVVLEKPKEPEIAEELPSNVPTIETNTVEEEKVIPKLHPMSESSEQIILDEPVSEQLVEETIENIADVPTIETPEVIDAMPSVGDNNITEENVVPPIPEVSATVSETVNTSVEPQAETVVPDVNVTVSEQEIVNQPETPATVVEQPLENNVEQVQVNDDTLSTAEVNSLANDGLTKDYSKYAELVTDTHILDQTIPALGITVYDYFENENINSKIAPNDEVVTQDGHPLPAKEFITNKILGHILEVPSLASDQLFMDAYNRRASYEYLFNIYAQEQRKQQTLDEVVSKNEKKKGLFGGLFHR